MKRHFGCFAAVAVLASMGVAQAGTFTVTTTASDGAGSFSQAIRDADASADPAPVIAFNITGAGPHYITPPASGFPLVLKDNLTIDGYSQPGSVVNTAPITQSNNAVIKIVLDARAPNNNFRDMAYVFYGTLTTSDPPINNASMAGSPPGTPNTFERGGFTPNSEIPYTRGEVTILGIYRATNVTIKGLAFLGDGSGTEYAVSVALDYGLDTAVKDRFAYPDGSCRGFHIGGCWIGIDPGTGAQSLSGAAIAAFRHRDKGTGGTRPELPNMENMAIGVKKGSATPRAEFNVLCALTGGLTIAAEGMRCRVSGNQFLGPAPSEIGRYDDTQAPSVVFGTDGDGVNDAEEGNLFPTTTPLFYNTGNKVYMFAGNTFGLARDGTRPNQASPSAFAVDDFGLNNRTKAVFGSNMDGLNDELEANTVYDTLGINVNAAAPDNNAWISLRGNRLVHNVAMLPMDELTGLNTYNKFIDTTSPNPITPVISAATTTSLNGSCGAPMPGISKIVVDIYESDPEGDTAGLPQGKVYRGSFADNSAADSNPAVGAFTFNTASLGITSGTKVTITANYVKREGGPIVTSITHSGGNTTINLDGSGPYNVFRAGSVSGPYTSIAEALASPVTFADGAPISFYRITGWSGAGQTSPFATSVTVP